MRKCGRRQVQVRIHCYSEASSRDSPCSVVTYMSEQEYAHAEVSKASNFVREWKQQD